MFDIALFKDIENKGLENSRFIHLEENKKINYKEKEELLELTKELPKLYQRNGNEVISKLITNYIERYPKSIEGYECFSKFYLKIKNYKSALNLIYAALYIDKENRILINLLKKCEENIISKACKIPIKYKSWICYDESRLYKEEKYNNNNNFTNEYLYSKKLQIIKHGQYYVALAKKNLIPGEVIFQTKPFILTQYVLSENFTYSTCYHCLKERNIAHKSYSCPINPHSCPFIFCNWKCLINNINIHKIECSILPIISAAAKESNLMYYTVLHIFRLLIKAKIDKEYKDKEHSILNDIFSVESYYDSVKESQKEVFESFNTLANRIILEFHPSFYLHLKQKELVELMLILWQYSPFIKYYSPSSIIQQANPETTFGLAYCPLLAKLHHSCVPTCSFYYDENGNLTIRSLYNIPEGGKLCISILSDQYLPLKIRKNFKGMPRVFGCGCSRCSDPTENNLHLRSMKCPRCIVGYIYPIKTEALIEALKLYRFDKQKEKKQKKNISLKNSQISNEETDLLKEINIENHNENEIENEKKKKKKVNSKMDTSLYYNTDIFNEKEKNILKKLEKEIERWLCSNCGKLSFSGNKRCIKLENRAYLLYNEAEKNYINGNIILARKQLLLLYKEFCYLLHPNHYIIFNTNVLLAGLLRYEPNKQLFDSLIYLRKAIIAAEEVLPVCSLEKVHLYLHLSEYTYSCSNLYKLYNKGSGISSTYVIDPLYTAIWNSCVITGYNSTLTVVLMQRLRNFAVSLNIFTPYKDIEFHINRKEEFCDFYYKVTQKKNDPFKNIKKVVDEDYFYPIYMASQCFDLDLEKNKYYMNIFKSFRKIQYFGNGLTALCLAASCGNVNLVKALLKLNYSIFFKNELNMNVLLYMASSFLPDEQISYHSNYYYTLLKEIEFQNVNFDNFEKDYYNSLNIFSTKKTTLLLKNGDNYMDSYNQKNYMEKTFHFDIVLDEEFIYGEKSKELDTNQATILIMFLRHLDELQLKKKKKYKQQMDMKKRTNFSENQSVFKENSHIDNKHSHLMKTLRKTGNSMKTSSENSENEKMMNHEIINKNENFSSNQLNNVNLDNSSFIDDSRYVNLDDINITDKDSIDNNIISKKLIDTNLNDDKNYSDSDKDTYNSSFDSRNSEDILNNKVNNYFAQKLLTKSVSHKLLGLNNSLHYACARGKRELAKQLIISGLSVMLLNDEGSTPLHIASFNGHNEIVKTLIKYKSDVNSITSHGETSLMLATYGLHYEVIKTLVENGAKIIIKNNHNVTILHCLVYGLLRTHTIYYKNKSCKDDISSLAIQGFNELNSSKYYTQGPTYLNINFLTEHIPIIEQLSHDFFLLPFKLLHRIKKAIIILKYLMAHCPIYLYEVKNSNGYNPYELLKAIWKKLSEKRVEILSVSDLRISSFSEKQKNVVFQAWSLITSLVNMILSILQPDRSILTSIYKKFIHLDENSKYSSNEFELEQKVKNEQNKTNSKENTNILEKNTNISKENTNISKENTNISKENATISKENATISKENTNVLKKNTNILKKNTNILKKNTSVLKENTNISKENTNISKENTNNSKENATISKENTNNTKENTNVSKENANNSKENTNVSKKVFSLKKALFKIKPPMPKQK
ncbi:SET domain protein, putative [Plasmodium gallinaceum]|uniref:SET domain protein, putative n=1 Tax=Plasmodium gallinaceum TaxID=5849 RepID=A0A1J1GZY3_PLAGA|nr:SET domain protein, putative [Plasmodium gallinaceum]CRG97857.1 SET domain protein, putative [Plasmodium gallinaceum]